MRGSGSLVRLLAHAFVLRALVRLLLHLPTPVAVLLVVAVAAALVLWWRRGGGPGGGPGGLRRGGRGARRGSGDRWSRW